MPLAIANVSNSAANVYVSSGITAITWLSLTNYSAGNATVTVNLVPSGDVAGNVNIVLANLDLAPQDTYQLYNAGEKIVMANGDAVVAVANASGAINAVTSYTGI